jgi:hypothetical protein
MQIFFFCKKPEKLFISVLQEIFGSSLLFEPVLEVLRGQQPDKSLEKIRLETTWG